MNDESAAPKGPAPRRTLFMYNNLVPFNTQTNRDINSLVNPPVGEQTNKMYENDLIRRVTKIVGSDKMIDPIPVLVSSVLNIMTALEKHTYRNVVYFGHVNEGTLQPIMNNDSGFSPNDFASTVHPVSDISLIGCYSLDFLRALRPLMIAYGKGKYEGRETKYWGTDTLVYQEIIGDFASGVKTNGLYQDVKGTADIQKVFAGPLLNLMGPTIK
jgi:hypothetical protein